MTFNYVEETQRHLWCLEFCWSCSDLQESPQLTFSYRWSHSQDGSVGDSALQSLVRFHRLNKLRVGEYWVFVLIICITLTLNIDIKSIEGSVINSAVYDEWFKWDSVFKCIV